MIKEVGACTLSDVQLGSGVADPGCGWGQGMIGQSWATWVGQYWVGRDRGYSRLQLVKFIQGAF